MPQLLGLPAVALLAHCLRLSGHVGAAGGFWSPAFSSSRCRAYHGRLFCAVADPKSPFGISGMVRTAAWLEIEFDMLTIFIGRRVPRFERIRALSKFAVPTFSI